MNMHSENRVVVCAFNSNHRMSPQRYFWHLAKCPDRKKREKQRLPIFVCQYHNMHIFLDKYQYEKHLPNCEYNSLNQNQEIRPHQKEEILAHTIQKTSESEESKELPFGAPEPKA